MLAKKLSDGCKHIDGKTMGDIIEDESIMCNVGGFMIDLEDDGSVTIKPPQNNVRYITMYDLEMITHERGILTLTGRTVEIEVIGTKKEGYALGVTFGSLRRAEMLPV